jgi:E3 UFM1-protein ligase 1
MVTSYVTSKVKTKHIVADVAHGVLLTAAHARQCIESIRATCSAAVEPVTVTELLALVHTNEQHVLQVVIDNIINFSALDRSVICDSSSTVYG